MAANFTTPPRASVVIPSRDGDRGGAVPRLLDAIQRQTVQDIEVILITGVFPQGKAINQGAARARGETLIVMDDDSLPADERVFERLLAVLDADPRVGMAGASIAVPPDASPFQRRAARQFPRFNVPVVDSVTESDLACHGCAAIPMAVFDAVGREREDIVRGLDPDLRMRLRAAGYRVVLAPDALAYHPLPGSWRGLCRTFFRNGKGSAYAYRFQRDSVFETHEQVDAASFSPRTTLPYRVLRFPLRLAKAGLSGQDVRLAAYGAYAAGYAWGLLTQRRDDLAAKTT